MAFDLRIFLQKIRTQNYLGSYFSCLVHRKGVALSEASIFGQGDTPRGSSQCNWQNATHLILL